MSSFQTATRPARPNRVRLGLQALESRDVPALIDLSVAGATGSANGALFRQMDAGPVAPDQFETFLRIRHEWVERGYNTDAEQFQFNVDGDHTTTHALQLADVPLVTVNGVAYRQFLLDVDETQCRPLISLDEFRIFVGQTADLSGYNLWTHKLAGHTAVFDMDAHGDVSVKLNAALNAGPGKGDAVVLVPDSVFGGATYVYLYSKFGCRYWANGGAEEWGVAPIPAATAGLSGYVYFDADDDGVREPNGNADHVPEIGLEGVSVRLQGTDDLGHTVDMTVITDANGFYQFTDLRAGVYSVTKMFDPAEFMDGRNTPGVPGNGKVQESNSDPAVADMIYDISLGTGGSLSEYNFGELALPHI